MLAVKNVSFSYKGMTTNVLEKVSFKIEPGQCLAILGNNGAGKSTLLKCINRICPIRKGSVHIDGKDAYKMNNKILAQNIAYVPQRTESNNMTVFDTVLLGRKPYIKWDITLEDRRIVADIINQMGLEKFALRNVSTLSGGEVQIVTLSRALAQQPKVLLLDEPTSNLDLKNQHEVLRIVRKIAEKNQISVVLVIHDLNLATHYCDKFLLLKDKNVYSYGGIETITADAIEAVYGIDVEILDYKNTKLIVALSD
ncbi:MAG: ABC transporter ATP-binding protein [Saccharofermentanales bacterium]